jgi:hypothetical protein
MKLSNLVVLLLNCAAVSTLAACGGGSGGDESRIRVLHASPDAPNVDVLIDGGKVLENVPYPVASDFLAIDAGHRQVTVTAAGTDTAVIDARVDFAEDTDYLIVAAGKLENIAPIVAAVDARLPDRGFARLRVLHSAASAPAVDVYVTAQDSGIADATPVLSNVPFRAISQYLDVPAGVYDIAVTVAGSKTVAIEAKALAVTDQLIATVAALDAPGGGAPFSLSVLAERSN